MAIYINFEKGGGDKLHDALVGSPAYYTGEIALVKDGNKDVLCVGENNEDNITINVKRAKFTNPLMKEYKNLGGFIMNEMNNNMELGLVEEETTMEHDVVSQPEIVEQEAETSMGEILVSALAGAVIGVATVVVADKLNKHVFEPVGRKLINKFKEAKAKRATETEEDIVVEVEESAETKTEDVEK